MTRLKGIFLAFCCIALIGCVAQKPNLTREQWLDMTSHTFKNTTVDEVLSSGERVLRLSDPSDVTIYHLQNKMVGSRKYNVYMVIAAEFGNYNFDLTATQIGSDVEAHLLIGHSSQSVVPVMTATPGAQGNGIGGTAVTGIANIGAPLAGPDQYNLFFNRIETIIYSQPWWVTCDEAEENKPDGALDSLCFNADDEIPSGAKLSFRSAQIIQLKKQQSSTWLGR